MSALRNALEFLETLGIFDTILPFLLVFTMIFAFLEKTKIYGTDKFRAEDGKIYDVSRKSLNSMTAFVIAFFVVASSQLVGLIHAFTGQVVLLIIVIFSFLLTVGAFHEEKEKAFYLQKPWSTIFTIIAFISIALIFLNAVGWLDIVIDFIGSSVDNEAVASIILVAVIVGFMVYITWDRKGHHEKSDKGKD